MSVLQEWLEEQPIRMQSTLLLGLRGNDSVNAPNIKHIARWLRGLAFKPGNPENAAEFMAEPPGRIADRSPAYKEFDFVSQHYFSHLLHAIQVVGFRHPDDAVAELARGLVSDMCATLHLEPETYTSFHGRLCQIDWPNGQPGNFKEAMAQLTEVKRGLALAEPEFVKA